MTNPYPLIEWSKPLMPEEEDEGTPPDWYDEKKLIRIEYDTGYMGWAIDCGDGTCRYVNAPLLGEKGPQWGDRVPLVKGMHGNMRADSSRIIEKFKP